MTKMKYTLLGFVSGVCIGLFSGLYLSPSEVERTGQVQPASVGQVSPARSCGTDHDVEFVCRDIDLKKGDEQYLSLDGRLYRIELDSASRAKVRHSQFPIRTPYLGRQNDLNRNGWITEDEYTRLLSMYDD